MAAKPSAASKPLKNWKSAQYVVNHATNTALETCKECASEYDRQKADLEQLANVGDQDSINGLASLEEKHAASYWKKASDSCRFSHSAKCSLVSEDVRALAGTRSQKRKIRKTAKQQKQEDESLEEELLALATPLDANIIVAPTLQPTSEQILHQYQSSLLTSSYCRSTQVALEEVAVKEEEDEEEVYTASVHAAQKPVEKTTRSVGKRAPAWSHKHLVSPHPTLSKQETCTACLDILLGERIVVKTYLYTAEDQEEASKRLRELESQIESIYWAYGGRGRMIHLADCQHQTPETRAYAALRRDARTRNKAARQDDAALASMMLDTDVGQLEKPPNFDSHAGNKVEENGKEELPSSGPVVHGIPEEILLEKPGSYVHTVNTIAHQASDDDEKENADNSQDHDFIEAEGREEEPKEEYIQGDSVKEEQDVQAHAKVTNVETNKPKKITSWQSSYLTVKHPTQKGKEGCKACITAITNDLEAALSETPPDAAAVQTIEANLSAVYWRAPRTRYFHLSKCARQPASVSEKAIARVNAIDEVQRRSDEKRAKRELEASSNAETVSVRKQKRTRVNRGQSIPAKQAPKQEDPRDSSEMAMVSSKQTEATLPSYFIPSSPQSLSWRA